MATRGPAAAPIRFGTSGWRGTLAREVTAERLRAVCWAVGRWALEEQGGARAPRIAVAHDTRFLGEELAALAARTLRAAGARVLPVASPVPTPVLAHAVWRGRADAGVMLTASHNPPSHHGLKLVTAGGRPAPPAVTARIERRARRALAAGAAREADGRAALRDAVGPYLEWITQHGLARGRPAAGLRVVYDAMHGAGAGIADRALARTGARVEVLRAARDAWFGGAAPEPEASRLGALRGILRRAGPRTLGLATDGDADRLAVVVPGGRVLDEATTLAVLVDHLARTGRLRRGLALTLATGSLPERVARAHGLPVERQPIGFKHLAAALAAGRADVAGDESGGFAWAHCGADKDGILAACLAAEAAATRGGLAARLRELARRHGRRHWGRAAAAASPGRLRRLERACARPPRRVAGARVVEVDRRDGLRLELPDGFVALRASGTEARMRIYAEATTRAALRRRLAAAMGLLGARRMDAPGPSG